MRITLQSPSSIADVELVGMDPDMPLRELMVAGGWNDPPELVLVDKRRNRTDQPLSTVNFVEGSVVREVIELSAPPRVELVRLAGLATGQFLQLATGTYDVGSSDSDTPAIGQAKEPRFRLEVHSDGTATALALAPGVIVEGDQFRRGRPLVITTHDAVYRVDPLAGESLGSVDPAHGKGAGVHKSVMRQPRLLASPAHPTLDLPPPPPEPRGAPTISWLVTLAPVPIGIVLAFFLSPYFLAFAAMSPIISIARWRDGKKRLRIDAAASVQYTLEKLHSFGLQIRHQADIEAQHRRDRYVDLRRQEKIADTGSPRLWEVRPHHQDHLNVTLGLGEATWGPTVARNPSVEGIDDLIEASSFLRSCPATVGLADVRGIGLVGPVEIAQKVAAAMLLELTVRQGPADIEVHCLLDVDSSEIWDWVKWLPHLYSTSGEPRLMFDRSATSAVLDLPVPDVRRGLDPDSSPAQLLLIDSIGHLRTGLPDVSAAVNRGAAVAIVVAESVDQLPAFCGAVVQVSEAGDCRVNKVDSGEVMDGILAPVADMGAIVNTARAMSRFVDPDVAGAAAQVPTRCKLSELQGTGLGTASVTERWGRSAVRSGGHLSAVLGVGAEGPFEVDLVRDGPHALVAGTTGAGKSELLRTLIASMAWGYSPDQVTFVLVDFKGGGAFDACANLPHTVGVVTDLDAPLAARALRCMRAELTYREHRLRGAGVSDLSELPETAEPLPRLVIVVDEFATLAAELPDFMESLVDVAQRGRSLGIHMVLATQRPAGVVDNKIRANTNLRIALRVQDDSDSIEVIGSSEAAKIHRTQQGRAFARLGAGELVRFQTALVSEPPAALDGVALRLNPFRLNAQRPEPQIVTPGQRSDQPSELELLSVSASNAAVRLALDVPRVPWPEPLPPARPLAELAKPGGSQWRVAVGEVDLPDEQRRSVFTWSGPEDGNVLVYGVDSADVAGVLGTFCTAIASSHKPDEAHLYVVDFAGALSALSDLPQVGGYLGPEDDERIGRLLDLLETLLDERRDLLREQRSAGLGPSDVPMIGLFIANYTGLLEHFDEQGDLDGAVRLGAILRDGPPLGVFMFASGTGERGIPMKVSAQVSTKFVLRLADSTSYSAFGLRARDIPSLGPGRAIDTRTGLEVQFAIPAWSVPSVSTSEQVANGPVRLRTLGSDISLDELAGETQIRGDLWRLAIGINHHDLSAALIDIRAGVHTVVAGPPASGRSTALRSIAASLAAVSPQTPIGSIGIELGTEVGCLISTAEELIQFGVEGGLLLVDNIEQLPVELSPDLEKLVAAAPQQLRIVVSGRNETLKGMQPMMRMLTASRTGLLPRPGTDAGDVFRCRLRVKGVYEAGRGFLLNGGTGGIAQIAHTNNFAVLVENW